MLSDGFELLIPGITYANVVQLELVFLGLVLAIAWWRPRAGERLLARAERAFLGLAERPVASLVALAAFTILLRLALLPWFPVPVPGTHDEFSFLLAADTFAQGRLANPPHPLWEHFESFHIIHQPTYASMYPPAQGILLWIGTLLGHPWIGMLLMAAALSTSLTWMLRGWFSPGWALAGGLIAACRLSLFTYWVNSYYGGALAATGGALILGALPRIRRDPKPAHALTFVAGAALLLNSRPLEGTVVLVCAGLTLLAWLARRQFPVRRALTRVAVPMCLALAILGALMAYYSWRVFGSPLTPPYVVNRAMYAVTPMFLFQPLDAPPVYRHDVMRRFFLGWEVDNYKYVQTLYGYRHALKDKYRRVESFYLGPALLLPLLLFPRSLLERRLRPLLSTGGILIGILLAEVWLFPHYLSPITGAIYAFVIEALRRLRTWQPRGRPVGLFVSRLIPALCILTVIAAATLRATGLQARTASSWEMTSATAGLRTRAALIDRLSQMPGQHLVIVRYAPEHNVHEEWVFNEADIDTAAIVWAREMDAVSNKRLLNYFRDRRAWLLEPDVDPTRIVEYPSSRQ